jgi:glycosyltransferase involved in cell wall biosynthesis
MISVCIPVYNFNITSLINELDKQSSLLNIPIEIVVIDDFSKEKYKEINRSACRNKVYIELTENFGRSKIRNLFLDYTKYQYLLFLDCDSFVQSPSFLERYVDALELKPLITCGGRIYDEQIPPKSKLLRWKYAKYRESQPIESRNKFPNRSFMTNNFLINREIFTKVKFDERITQYGHEDTLFGYSLKKENIPVTHIDNPVVNGDIEDNSEYLEKTRVGIINLINILEYYNYDRDLIDEVSLLRYHQKIKRFNFIIRLSFYLCKPLIYFTLTRGYISLLLFDFYKLGVLAENYKK